MVAKFSESEKGRKIMAVVIPLKTLEITIKTGNLRHLQVASEYVKKGKQIYRYVVRTHVTHTLTYTFLFHSCVSRARKLHANAR